MSTVNTSRQSGIRAGRVTPRQFHLRFLLALTAGCAGVFAARQLWGWLGGGIGVVFLAEAVIVWYARNRASAALNLAAITAAVALIGLFLLPLSTSRVCVCSRRADCQNKLRSVAFALQMYHDDHGAYPPAYTVDEQGKRLHSWRSLVLPYLELNHLYDDIRFDEPWDSEHNSQYHDIRIPILVCPSDPNYESTREARRILTESYDCTFPVFSVAPW